MLLPYTINAQTRACSNNMVLSAMLLPASPCTQSYCAAPAPQVHGACPMSLRGECKGRVVKREFLTNHNFKKREQRIAAAVAGPTAAQLAAKAQHAKPKPVGAVTVAVQAIMSSSSSAILNPNAYKDGPKKPDKLSVVPDAGEGGQDIVFHSCTGEQCATRAPCEMVQRSA